MSDRHARHRHRPADPRRRPTDGYRADTPARFDRLVHEALQTLPRPILEHLQQVELLTLAVPPAHPEGPRQETPSLATYQTRVRGQRGRRRRPDRLVLYRRPLELRSRDAHELRAIVRHVVLREVAHHLGIDDDGIEERGWL